MPFIEMPFSVFFLYFVENIYDQKFNDDDNNDNDDDRIWSASSLFVVLFHSIGGGVFFLFLFNCFLFKNRLTI